MTYVGPDALAPDETAGLACRQAVTTTTTKGIL
jgi:hypothetical protein